VISAPLARVLRRFVLIQRVMCVYFTAAIPIYGGVVLLTRSAHIGAGRIIETSVLLVIATAAAIIAVASVLHRRWCYSDAYLDRLLGSPIDVRRLATPPRTGRVDENLAAKIDALVPHERTFVTLFVALQTPLLINLALNELIALIGFVPAFLAQDLTVFLPFAVAAVALNLCMWPAPDRLYARVQAKLLALPTA
jgi:hypothetical protein